MSVRAILLTLLLLPLVAVAQEVTLPQVGSDSVWCPQVKSLRLEKDGSAPILTLSAQQATLDLEFDLLGEEPADLRYRIVHCDRLWRPDLPDAYDYLQGFEEENLSRYESSFTTLQPYFHYFQRLPSQGTRFLASGNYLLLVYLEGAPDSVLFTRRFWVVEPMVEVEATVGKPMDGSVMQEQGVDVALTVREGQTLRLNPEWTTVQVRQNGRTDLERTLPFTGYESSRLLYRWRRENVFPGGNTFRYFDNSNLHVAMYNVMRTDSYGLDYFSMLRPLEDRSRRPFTAETTLNGGWKCNAFDRSNPTLMAEYVWVNFSLPLSQPYLDGTVHVVGALTDWRIDESSRMEWHPEMKAYTLRLLLKQGYYAYQLLFLPAGERIATTNRLEGNHFNTPNDYTVLVYYRHPSDLSDRLVGCKQIAYE